jgi:hypothetical protein
MTNPAESNPQASRYPRIEEVRSECGCCGSLLVFTGEDRWETYPFTYLDEEQVRAHVEATLDQPRIVLLI